MHVIPPNSAVPAVPGVPPLPPGGAAAATAPLAIPAVPVLTCTFTELYSTPASDAHAEPAASQNTPTEIWAALNNMAEGFLQAYLLLGPDGQMTTIHTVTCYPTCQA